MKINKTSISYFLSYIFSMYDDRFDQMPELTPEGFASDIENMKNHAKNSGELLELRLMLDYIKQLDYEAMQEFLPVNESFEDDEENTRLLLYLALESNWQELGDIAQYQLSDITFIDVPLQEWRPQKIKEKQAKERGSKE
jgi:hypothetical protein